MIEILKDFPDDVLAISGSGWITAEDYRDVVVPEIERHIEKHGKVHLLYHLGPEFEGISPGGAWSDMSVGLSHWNQFGRIAVVTDADWIRHAMNFFASIFHDPVRTFPNAELAAAKDWISARETVS